MGALDGFTIVEIAGIGPTPFAAMMLADHGARVIRIDRPGGPQGLRLGEPRRDILNRGRRSLALDLKSQKGRDALLRIIGKADALIEGLRPGAMERLRLGPDVCFEANPKLVYGRMTGWGQTGPLAMRAGHDITYAALPGALAAIGPKDGKPSIPLNLIADFGGGAMYLLFGLLAALLAAQRSGEGQVVDAAMVDGVASLMSIVHGMDASGFWRPERESNLLDGGTPFYDVYECADGKWLAIGPLEPQFFAEFLRLSGLDTHPDCKNQFDMSRWPAMRRAIAQTIRTRTRDDWDRLFADTDACVAPVLDYREAPAHRHLKARGVYVEKAEGGVEPAPAPRFSKTPGRIAGPPAVAGEHSADILAEFGFSRDEIAALLEPERPSD